MARSLWNIGTHEDPIIQGQDGLPFYHEKGGWIKYGSDSSTSYVNNNCLCHCRNYLYYVNYIHLDTQNRRIFKHPETPGNYILTSNSISGYVFNKAKLYCIPTYLPKGTFQTGISQIPDLPYSDRRVYNQTAPCPQYYKKNAPFRAATTIRRYINTYGSSDCGTPVSSDSLSSSLSTGLWRWAEFYVNQLNTPLQITADLIYGTEGATNKFPPKEYVQLLDCNTARVRAVQLSLDDPFDYSNSSMKQRAIQLAQDQIEQHECTYWQLYRINISCCSSQQHWSDWQRIYAADTPDYIWGKGDGWGFQFWHDAEQQFSIQQGSWVSIYQWVGGRTQELNPPVPISETPCDKICSQYYKYASDSSQSSTNQYIECSQSSSCSSCPQPKPCNIMKQFPYFYKKADVKFPLFTIWRMYPDSPEDQWVPIDTDLNDWQLLPQWDGQWTKVYKDSNSNITAIDILVDKSDGYPGDQIEYDRMHQLWDQQDEEDFREAHKNYWQIYFDCGGKYGVCDPPRLIYRMITEGQWEDIAQEHHVCLDKWQLANNDNTFTPQEEELPGKFVYTVEVPIDIPQLCYILNAGASSITLTGNGQYSHGYSKLIQFPRKFLQVQMYTVEAGQILREDPLYIKSEIVSDTLLFSSQYSSNSISNLDCFFHHMPTAGWYQEPKNQQEAQGPDKLDTAYWRGALPQEPLVWAHRDLQDILTPGRKDPAQGQQQGDAICSLYYIAWKSYGWTDVWTDEGQGYCNHQGYIIQDVDVSLSLPQKINWQRDCAKPTPYGLKVYVIGPAVFPGIQFQRSQLPSNITGFQTAYKVDGEVLIDLSQSSQTAWRDEHGNRTIDSGFYTVSQSLPISWFLYTNSQIVVFPQYMQRETFTPSASCVTWDLSNSKVNCPITHYDTMPWRIYIAFGPKNGLNEAVGIRGINGQNTTISRKVGFPLVFNRTRVCHSDSKAALPEEPALRLYPTVGSYGVIQAYYSNKSPDIELAPDQHQYIWPGDSNSHSFSISTGFLVPDPQGVSLFGKKLSKRGTDTSTDTYYWKQSISGQTYGTSNQPWWILQLSDIDAFKVVSSSPCVYDVVYVPVQEKLLGPVGNTKKYKHARMSAQPTAAGYTYIKSKITSSTIGGTNISQIYASNYLITGQYDSYDAQYAFYNGGSWQSVQTSYFQNRKITDTTGFIQYTNTIDINALPGTSGPFYGVTKTKDCRTSPCTSNSSVWDWDWYTTFAYAYRPNGYIRGNVQGCNNSTTCTDDWYMYFDYIPQLRRAYFDVQTFPDDVYLKMTDSNCNGRKRVKLLPFSNTSQVSVNFTHNYSEQSGNEEITGECVFSGIYTTGTPPSSWFPQGNNGL